MRVRTLIVEDEPLARRSLRDLSSEDSSLEIIGEAVNGREAVRMIDELRPDLVLLDIQMPELSGLEVLDRVEHAPAVIFTTAYDAYAVSAFELGALDYLLKPFGRERFRTAVRRARERLGDSANIAPMRERARAAFEGVRVLTRLFIRHGGKIIPVPTEDVTRLQADGDYVRVITGGRAYLVELTMSEFERRLDPARFLRVHRSHIVNTDHIASMEAYDARRLLLRMRDGSEVLASRAGSERIQELIL